MWYCAICTHKITSYQTSIQCNHTTPHWIHLKCSHIKLKSYSPSFICHTHQISTPKTPPHIHNLTQKTFHKHQQTKPTTQNQPTPPLTTPNNINIIQLNINSITKKTTELTHLIHKQKIHIITLQESNLNSKHKTPNILNFSAIRLDRSSSQKGGGLLTYINNNITYSQIPTPTNLITNNIELITTKIHLKHTNLHISNVYIPPNTNKIDNSITNLFIHLTSLPISIITGDFNAHSQTWHSPFTDHRSQLITSLILNSNHIILNQNTSTRLPFNPNQQPTSPDITTADTTISANLTWQTLKALNFDHFPILIKFKNKYKIPTTKPFRTLTNYKKANWPQFTKHIEHTLKNTPLHEDPHTANHLITNAILTSDRINIPKGIIKPTHNPLPESITTSYRNKATPEPSITKIPHFPHSTNISPTSFNNTKNKSGKST